MILSLKELREQDFCLSRINIFLQKPRYRRLYIKKREMNSFLCILHGNCTYSFEGGRFELVPGSVVYLPYGSNHTLEVHSDVFAFYRLDFHLTVGEEIVLFSDRPKKMCHVASEECAAAIQAMAVECQFVQNTIRKAELLSTIFRTLDVTLSDTRRERLAPAIGYLVEHLTEKVECENLARSCCLGSSQFYNLFREEYHMTPLEYRDRLRMERAVVLLRDGAFSVAEVAEELGFESVSYFSRFFKKHQGVSPSKFT